MAEPPVGMEVVLDHDGATWVLPNPLGRAAVAVVLGAWTAAIGGAAVVAPYHLLAIGAGAVLLPTGWLALLRLARRRTVRVSVRTLSWPGGAVRLDDVARIGVSTDPLNGRSALLVETVRGDRHLIGLGESRDHLRYFADCVGAARGMDAQRAAIEGREWSFLRHAPAELARLRAEEHR